MFFHSVPEFWHATVPDQCITRSARATSNWNLMMTRFASMIRVRDKLALWTRTQIVKLCHMELFTYQNKFAKVGKIYFEFLFLHMYFFERKMELKYDQIKVFCSQGLQYIRFAGFHSSDFESFRHVPTVDTICLVSLWFFDCIHLSCLSFQNLRYPEFSARFFTPSRERDNWRKVLRSNQNPFEYPPVLQKKRFLTG